VRVDWSLQTLSVDAVTGSWANRSIRPNPEYQRGLQWKRRQQQLLIDSRPPDLEPELLQAHGAFTE
jgi:hypothetical protein